MNAAALKLIDRHARCHDPRASYSDLFFSEDRYDIARAQAICAKCPARAACLAVALEREEPCGVWGGMVFVDGQPKLERRGRGRPRKVPLAPLVVAEVPDVA